MAEIDRTRRAASLIKEARRMVLISGAGLSVDAGVKDFRSSSGWWRNIDPRTVATVEALESHYDLFHEFYRMRIEQLQHVVPHQGHRILAEWEKRGMLACIGTQNVDGLHQAAGSRRVIELHGSLAWVRCLGCGARVPRSEFQDRLMALNPEWADHLSKVLRTCDIVAAPDGDADLPDGAIEEFRVPGCEVCGGIMKPDVVYFGENVPRARVDEAWRLYEEGEVLLVVGSSLTVYSGRRFVDRARGEGVPVGVVNLGPTRADEVAAVKVEARAGQVLPAVADALL